jgi:hypothetical protein
MNIVENINDTDALFGELLHLKYFGNPLHMLHLIEVISFVNDVGVIMGLSYDDNIIIRIIYQSICRVRNGDTGISNRWEITREKINTNPKEISCPICYEDTLNVCITQCDHEFCNKCIEKIINLNKYNDRPNCAMCRAPIMKIKQIS